MKVLLLADVGPVSSATGKGVGAGDTCGRAKRRAGQGAARLGWRGDLVEVSTGYARNFLLPQGLAIEACEAPPALAEALAKERAKRTEEIERERRRLEEISAAVDGAEVVIGRAANEQGRLFGSVTSSDIATSLAEQGFEVVADAVQLAEHIKEVGTYAVGLKLVENLTATINVVVVAKIEDEGERTGQGDKEVN